MLPSPSVKSRHDDMMMTTLYTVIDLADELDGNGTYIIFFQLAEQNFFKLRFSSSSFNTARAQRDLWLWIFSTSFVSTSGTVELSLLCRQVSAAQVSQPPRGPSGQGVRLETGRPGFDSRFPCGSFLPGRVIPVTYRLALQWLSYQCYRVRAETGWPAVSIL